MGYRVKQAGCVFINPKTDMHDSHHTYIVHKYTYTHTHIYTSHIHTHIYTYIYTYTHTYIYIHTHSYIHTCLRVVQSTGEALLTV